MGLLVIIKLYQMLLENLSELQLEVILAICYLLLLESFIVIAKENPLYKQSIKWILKAGYQQE
jgi:hypothetical protein